MWTAERNASHRRRSPPVRALHADLCPEENSEKKEKVTAGLNLSMCLAAFAQVIFLQVQKYSLQRELQASAFP
jgi:hypothetical protein